MGGVTAVRVEYATTRHRHEGSVCGVTQWNKVDSNVWTVDDLDGTFCIQMPADDSGLPSSADATNCVVFETAMAWGSAVFPFLRCQSLFRRQ